MRKLYPLARHLRIVSKTIGSKAMLTLLFFGLFVVSANAQTTRYVNASASGANDGSSWTDAFTNLQSALDVAVSGDEIWVAKGTYVPSKDETGSTAPSDVRTKTFLLKSGVALLGGFNAVTNTRDVKANATILSGDVNGNDVGFLGNGENMYHVVAARNLTATTVLDGFAISGGNANGSGSFLVEGRNIDGAAIYLYGGGQNLTINNCLIASNSQSYGALHFGSASPKVTNCVFSGNKAAGGGAVECSGTSAPSFVNCLFVDNSASYGGALLISDANANITNCTFYRNTSSSSGSFGGIIYCYNNSNTTMSNSIFWSNTFPAGMDGILASTTSGATITVKYSNVQNGFIGTGNINTDPLFLNASDPDGADNIWGTADDGLQLLSTSPAADLGDNAAVAGIATDITGAARIQNSTVDMGVYEIFKAKTAQTIAFSAGATVTKIYGDGYTVNATASSGLPVTYSIVSGPATISGSAITFTGTGSVVVKATQVGDATFDAAEATQTITVNKKAVTVTVIAFSKAYGDPDPTLTYVNTGLAPGDAFTGNLKRDAGENVGTYAINQNDLALNSNYNLTYVGADLTIGARNITLKANDASKLVGETTVFTGNEYSITSGVLASGDAISSVSLSSNGETALAAAGTYPILIGGAVGISTTNYNITYVDGTLTVNACPTIMITTPPADKTVCPGGSVTFSVAATGSGLTYKWLKGGAYISGANADTYTIPAASASDADNYSVEVSNGCSTVTSTAATLSVNVSTKITVQPVAKTVCATGSATFSFSATGSNLSFLWYKDGAPISNATSATLTLSGVTAAQAGNYSVEVIGDCGSEMSTSVALEVLPLTAITTHPISEIVCEGGSVTFSGSAAGSGVTYKWQKDGFDIPGTFSNSYTIATVTAGDAGNYKLVATSACGVATSTAASLTVNAIPAKPTIGTGSATTFCVGGSVVLTSSAVLGNQWYKDGAAIGGATAQTYTATTSGSYTVIVTSGSCASVASAATVVAVNATPTTPVITATGNILTSSASTGNQWYLNGSAITGATGQTHRVQAAGLYTVQVTSGTCSSTSVDYNFVATRIDNPENWNREVVVYPNPTVKTLFIKNTASRKLRVQLYDGFGRKVHESQLHTSQGAINIEGLANGVYHLVITDVVKNVTISQSIVKL